VEEVPIQSYTGNRTVQVQLKQAQENLMAMIDENEELKKQLQHAKEEAQRATAKTNDYKAALNASKKREQLLSNQVKQLAIFSDLTHDRLLQSKADTGAVSQRLLQGQGQSLFPSNEDIERDLQAQGLGSEVVGNLTPQQKAMRAAQVAASLVDPSGGKLLQQWASTGDNAASKLSRIQDRIASLESDIPTSTTFSSGSVSYPGGSQAVDSKKSLGNFLQRSDSNRSNNQASGYNGYFDSSNGLKNGSSGGSYSTAAPSPLSPQSLETSGPGTGSGPSSPLDRSASLNRFQLAGKKTKSYMSATKSSTRNVRTAKNNGNSSVEESQN
jgi:hypothetical protein